MPNKYTEETSKFTCKAYYLVPKSNPAQRAVLFDRKDFTKPVEKEI